METDNEPGIKSQREYGPEQKTGMVYPYNRKTQK